MIIGKKNNSKSMGKKLNWNVPGSKELPALLVTTKKNKQKKKNTTITYITNE